MHHAKLIPGEDRDTLPLTRAGHAVDRRWRYPNRVKQLQRTLVRRIHFATGEDRSLCQAVCKWLWDEIKILLLAGKEIDLKDFGKFYVIRVRGSDYTRPDGRTVHCPPSARFAFKPANLMLRWLAYYSKTRLPPPGPDIREFIQQRAIQRRLLTKKRNQRCAKKTNPRNPSVG